MKANLQLQFSQHITLTPQLQESIRLLQLSTFELQQEISSAVAQNPLLDNDNDWTSSVMRIKNDGSICTSQINNFSTNHISSIQDPTPISDSIFSEKSNLCDSTNCSNNENLHLDFPSFSDIENTIDSDTLRMQLPIGLHDHLLAQLQLTQANQRDRAISSFLIGLLNDDGYLNQSLDDTLEELPKELNIEIEELQAALSLIQSFEPCGIAARSASECLRLQLLKFNSNLVRQLALDIVDHHLSLLAAHDFTKLKRILKTDENMLRQAHSLILSLEPFPGAAYSNSTSNYIIPDILVYKNSDRWDAELNPSVIPKLKINSLYANILRKNRNDSESGSLRYKLQEARWLIKNIDQRFQTILRVGKAIVERQKSFFTYGEIAMRPLVLREIADTLGLHESTVSRVTSGKYMSTPFGILEFKYFFGSSVSTDTGGLASATAIRSLIKKLIGMEDTRMPLSDNRISKILSEQGFVVARRTVAKYREFLGIPPVNLRKIL